jgi:hypothetical protein
MSAQRDIHRKICKIFWPLRINLNIEFSFKWLVANVLNLCIGCSSSYKITMNPAFLCGNLSASPKVLVSAKAYSLAGDLIRKQKLQIEKHQQ